MKPSIFIYNIVLIFFCLESKPNFYYERDTKETMSTSDHHNPWRSVRDLTRDTVVQIFAQIAEFDWLQPFRTPAQYAVRGSGFFINEEGYIITNAHVVDQSVAIWIQMPESLGKWPIKASIVSICPDRDIALLKVDDADIVRIKQQLGRIPFLYLGNSDTICRADEVLGLGYPLGYESLKVMEGGISGWEHVFPFNQYYIQTDTPLNPGVSGGPLINIHGEVIAINTAGVTDAQNVGYAIPINDFKIIVQDLLKTRILHKPFAGLITVKENDYYTDYLDNPGPGGCFVLEVVKGSLLDKAGIQHGDMIYKINGLPVDIYGEICADWNNDVRLSIMDYISSLACGKQIELEVYRNGKKMICTFQTEYINPLPIRRYYPWHETPEYEVFAGMVIMPLTLNHIKIFAEQVPGLIDYSSLNTQAEPILVITHIFPNSEVARGRSVATGYTINRVNGREVRTLEEFRAAIVDHPYAYDEQTGKKGFVHIEVADQITGLSDRIPVVLPIDLVTKELMELSSLYRYPIASWIQDLHKKMYLQDQTDIHAIASFTFN